LGLSFGFPTLVFSSRVAGYHRSLSPPLLFGDGELDRELSLTLSTFRTGICICYIN